MSVKSHEGCFAHYCACKHLYWCPGRSFNVLFNYSIYFLSFNIKVLTWSIWNHEKWQDHSLSCLNELTHCHLKWIVHPKMKVQNNLRLSKWWQNLNCWVNYPFKYSQSINPESKDTESFLWELYRPTHNSWVFPITKYSND